ncbi:MAG: 50S ribosomal protein L3 [Candidatus Saganbacteria bacterium]|nr:50S ribosomal protein L3 [Candidatus Saganbacteria bacterium]
MEENKIKKEKAEELAAPPKVEEKKAEVKAEEKKPLPIKGLLGRKVGMTQIYREGRVIPVTVIEAGPCTVIQKKGKNSDGYCALQLGFGKKKNVNKPVEGHLKRANPEIAPEILKEIKVDDVDAFAEGQEIKVDIFKSGDIVNVQGRSIGKGFAGTVKKYHFSRGPMAHGSKSHRIPGSIGSGTTPGRVYKGKKMPGRMGGVTVTTRNLEVVDVRSDKNLLLLKGSVPGPGGNILVIRKR